MLPAAKAVIQKAETSGTLKGTAAAKASVGGGGGGTAYSGGVVTTKDGKTTTVISPTATKMTTMGATAADIKAADSAFWTSYVQQQKSLQSTPSIGGVRAVPTGDGRTLHYDSAGKVIATTLASGKTVNSLGQTVALGGTQTTPDGRTLTFDALGKLTSTTLPSGERVSVVTSPTGDITIQRETVQTSAQATPVAVTDKVLQTKVKEAKVESTTPLPTLSLYESLVRKDDEEQTLLSGRRPSREQASYITGSTVQTATIPKGESIFSKIGGSLAGTATTFQGSLQKNLLGEVKDSDINLKDNILGIVAPKKLSKDITLDMIRETGPTQLTFEQTSGITSQKARDVAEETYEAPYRPYLTNLDLLKQTNKEIEGLGKERFWTDKGEETRALADVVNLQKIGAQQEEFAARSLAGELDKVAKKAVPEAEAVTKEVSLFEQKAKSFESNDKALQQAYSSLDLSDPVAVAAFNQRIEAHQNKYLELKTLQESLQPKIEKIEAYQKDIDYLGDALSQRLEKGYATQLEAQKAMEAIKAQDKLRNVNKKYDTGVRALFEEFRDVMDSDASYFDKALTGWKTGAGTSTYFLGKTGLGTVELGRNLGTAFVQQPYTVLKRDFEAAQELRNKMMGDIKDKGLVSGYLGTLPEAFDYSKRSLVPGGVFTRGVYDPYDPRNKDYNWTKNIDTRALTGLVEGAVLATGPILQSMSGVKTLAKPVSKSVGWSILKGLGTASKYGLYGLAGYGIGVAPQVEAYKGGKALGQVTTAITDLDKQYSEGKISDRDYEARRSYLVEQKQIIDRDRLTPLTALGQTAKGVGEYGALIVGSATAASLVKPKVVDWKVSSTVSSKAKTVQTSPETVVKTSKGPGTVVSTKPGQKVTQELLPRERVFTAKAQEPLQWGGKAQTTIDFKTLREGAGSGWKATRTRVLPDGWKEVTTQNSKNAYSTIKLLDPKGKVVKTVKGDPLSLQRDLGMFGREIGSANWYDLVSNQGKTLTQTVGQYQNVLFDEVTSKGTIKGVGSQTAQTVQRDVARKGIVRGSEEQFVQVSGQPSKSVGRIEKMLPRQDVKLQVGDTSKNVPLKVDYRVVDAYGNVVRTPDQVSTLVPGYKVQQITTKIPGYKTTSTQTVQDVYTVRVAPKPYPLRSFVDTLGANIKKTSSNVLSKVIKPKLTSPLVGKKAQFSIGMERPIGLGTDVKPLDTGSIGGTGGQEYAKIAKRISEIYRAPSQQVVGLPRTVTTPRSVINVPRAQIPRAPQAGIPVALGQSLVPTYAVSSIPLTLGIGVAGLKETFAGTTQVPKLETKPLAITSPKLDLLASLRVTSVVVPKVSTTPLVSTSVAIATTPITTTRTYITEAPYPVSPIPTFYPPTPPPMAIPGIKFPTFGAMGGLGEGSQYGARGRRGMREWLVVNPIANWGEEFFAKRQANRARPPAENVIPQFGVKADDTEEKVKSFFKSSGNKKISELI